MDNRQGFIKLINCTILLIKLITCTFSTKHKTLLVLSSVIHRLLLSFPHSGCGEWLCERRASARRRRWRWRAAVPVAPSARLRPVPRVDAAAVRPRPVRRRRPESGRRPPLHPPPRRTHRRSAVRRLPGVARRLRRRHRRRQRPRGRRLEGQRRFDAQLVFPFTE